MSDDSFPTVDAQGSGHAPTTSRRFSRRDLKLLLLAQLVLVILAVPITEITFRIVARAHGVPHDSEAVREEIEQIQSLNLEMTPRPRNDRQLAASDNPRAAPILHPYVGFEVIDSIQLVDDELAYLHSDADPGRIDILIVGGSVADMFGQTEYGTGPLEEFLHADPRLSHAKFHFLKFGRGGFKEPQQASYVSYLLALGFKPKVVINIDGFNEVTLGNNNAQLGTNPLFPSAQHWAHLANWGAVDRNGLDIVLSVRENQRAIERWTNFALEHHFEKSCALSTLVLGRLHLLRKQCVEDFDRYAALMGEMSSHLVTRGPDYSKDLTTAVALCVRGWAESSRTIQDMCRGRSMLYLHILQPSMLDEGSKKFTPVELAHAKANEHWVDGARVGYPWLRKMGANLAAQGVNFVDCTQIFAQESGDIYYDCVHFGEAGNRILAKRIANELLARWDQIK
jgi:hypothetical protein